MSSQDCVVTSFFIDCAHNVVEFIELIHRILKPGGKWINFGPLLYHFAEIPRESSIEPSYDIVRSIIEKTGFEFKREGKLNSLDAVTSSGILKAKQKLSVAFNFDKQDVIDLTKFSKMTMCRASEANSEK